MSRWTPCKRQDFVRRLRALGFDGPWSGTRHQFMTRGDHRLTIPTNPEYSVPQLRMLIREAEKILGKNVSLEDWEGLL
jgi:hypothetical protein